MAIPIPNIRMEAFRETWLRASSPILPSDRDKYWNPLTGKWDDYKQDAYTFSTLAVPPPKYEDLGDTEKIFKAVEASWTTIRKDHATAVYDPRGKTWCTAKAVAPTKPPPDKPPAMSKEERERRCNAELADLDRQYRENPSIWNQEEYEQQRKAIRQKWGLE
jgi:hypothetical protein